MPNGLWKATFAFPNTDSVLMPISHSPCHCGRSFEVLCQLWQSEFHLPCHVVPCWYDFFFSPPCCRRYIHIIFFHPQVLERVPLHMPLQQQVWCMQWPMPAPWANWRHVAVMRSGAATRRPSAPNCTACSWRPSTGGRAWYMASWSTSPPTCRDPRTPGSGAAAVLMWNSERSSHGTSWMPVRPTKTSTPVWGSTIIELGDRWVTIERMRVFVATVWQLLQYWLTAF